VLKRSSCLALLAICIAGAPAVAGAQEPAYRETRLSFAERAADLVSRMTLEEKAAQLSTSNAPEIPRLGVAEYAYWSEALHGVNAFWGGDNTAPANTTGAVRATSFPTNLSASLAWNPALMRRVADAISDEARGFVDPSLSGRASNDLGLTAGAYGNLFYFAPTVNMDRDPRWGRVDETFGEDPLLTGTLGTAWVRGFQGSGRYRKAVATLKHYALNNVENNRMGRSSNTDEGTIRDYYTRQFRDIIEAARPGGVMSSYNAINGVPAVADNLTLNVLLRRTFGFGGYTTSDCGAVGTTYRANNPGAENPADPASAAVITSGHDWAPPGWSTDHAGLAARWTRGATSVRAKAGGEAFSLRAGTGLNCIGDNGLTGHGSVLDGARPAFSDENGVGFVREAIAAGILGEDVIDRQLLQVFTQRMRTGEFDPRAGQPYTKITRSVIESAGHRRLAQTLAEQTLTLLQNERPRGARRPLLPVSASSTRKVVVVGDQADEVFLGDYSGDPREKVSLLDGIKRVLPRATVTYDAAGTSTTATGAPALQPATRTAIRAADLVVVMVGTDAKVNAEGYDRKNLELPGNYGQLVKTVAAVGNPRIVLVDQSAGPVELSGVRGRVASILFSAANGQRLGLAAARAIVGQVNPSGHLSFTWYAGDRQLPSKQDYDLTPSRTDGLGRTYMYFTRKPAYPFGYGRSYTTFGYSQAGLSRSRVRASSTARISFSVTNTGGRPGATVAQVYATPPQGALRRKLVGFRRTEVLAPGESRRITITVPLTGTLRAWSASSRRQVVTRGTWRFTLARSATDPVRTFAVRVAGRIPRSVKTVTLAPAQLSLARGQTIDLRGRNPWFAGLAPAHPQADQILSAVRADDSFADLADTSIRFSSNRPSVASVDGKGVVTARGPGVATIKATVQGVTATTPIVVSPAAAP
jgi:beta-glucosidase